MLGNTHLKIGIITAITASIVIQDNLNILEIVGAATISGASSILTSQLPDLDSDTSAISKKIPIIKYLKNKTGILLDFIISAIMILLFYNKNLDIFLIASEAFAFYGLFRCLIIYLFKHRTFTHSLLAISIISIGPLIIFYQYPEEIMLAIIIGLIAGYSSHVFFDSLTIKGSPLLWPIIKKKISFYHWKAGKDDPKAIRFAIVLSVIIIILKYYIKLYGHQLI